jgi:hypothetical protein
MSAASESGQSSLTEWFFSFISSQSHIVVTLVFPEPDVLCAAKLLKKYVSLVCYHVSEVLQLATRTAARCHKHFALVAKIVAEDISGKILTNNNLRAHRFVRF